MNKYVIVTDSSCDLPPEKLRELEVEAVELTFSFEPSRTRYTNSQMRPKDFYRKMRCGAHPKTAAANIEDFNEIFTPILDSGQDILCVSFSSALSTTCNSASIAASELSTTYPNRKIIVVDSLCASAGLGLLVYMAVLARENGMTLEENAAYLGKLKSNIGHWFTVNDLVYLKRGGRLSSAATLAGSLLGIKPILHADDNGKLVSVSKARGRKQSLTMIAEKFFRLVSDDSDGTYFISHGDCLEDAKALEDIIASRTGLRAKMITDIGPVIGAHAGPGTVALFFVAKER